MLPEERKRRIVELVTARDGCTVAELSTELDFSETTIRRDLDDLDGQNLIERTHGGAMPVVDRISDYERRARKNRAAKEAIAERAVEEIHEEQVVLLDAGSTTLEVSKRIPEDLAFVAVTNHPLIVHELGGKAAKVQLTGGTFEKEHQILWGPLAERVIERMEFDIALLGTEGVHAEAGLTTAYDDAARIKELMITNSRRSVVLADHSKLGKRNIVRYAAFSDIDLLVTDGELPEDIAKVADDRGVTCASQLTS
jgi:DeoR family fructose operon transcriptional repressor